MTFGNLIKKLRLNKHMTQAKVAEKLKVSQSTYSRLEGNKQIPSIDYLIELSFILNTSLKSLILAL